MIEVLKQMQEALESATVDCSNFHHAKKDQNHNLGECPPVIRWHHAIEAGKQAIKELESQEPVAWMHIMDNTEGIKANGAGIVSITQKRKHPFGKVGIDFSKSYSVTSTPLYTRPPQRTEQNFCPRCGKRTNDIHTCTPPQD